MIIIMIIMINIMNHMIKQLLDPTPAEASRPTVLFAKCVLKQNFRLQERTL